MKMDKPTEQGSHPSPDEPPQGGVKDPDLAELIALVERIGGDREQSS
jgi:hypothetical protein